MDIKKIVMELKANMKMQGHHTFLFDERVATEVLERELATQDHSQSDESLDVEGLTPLDQATQEKIVSMYSKGVAYAVAGGVTTNITELQRCHNDIRQTFNDLVALLKRVGYTRPKKITEKEIDDWFYKKELSYVMDESRDQILIDFCKAFDLLEE